MIDLDSAIIYSGSWMNRSRLNAIPILSALFVAVVALASLPMSVYLSMQRQPVKVNAATGSSCTEQCPGQDGVLRNCHPPEADGTSEDSICTYAGRVAFCGTQNFCCPSKLGKWTTDMTKCPNASPTPTPACTDSSWSPDPATQCQGVTFTQTSNCGVTRQSTGTNTAGSCCTDTTWTPGAADQCSGASFTQTSNCGRTRQSTGTNTAGSCCTDTTWTPASSTVCSGQSVTQTSNCGRTRTVVGSSTAGNCCVPNGTITCNQDCNDKCGYNGGVVSCRDSCGRSVNKTCPSTSVCGMADGSCEPVDGGWSEWGPCSSSICGTSGIQVRSCTSPTTSCGGTVCTGESIRSCVAEDCSLVTSDQGGSGGGGIGFSGAGGLNGGGSGGNLGAGGSNENLPNLDAGITNSVDAEKAKKRKEVISTITSIILLLILLAVLYYIYKKMKEKDKQDMPMESES